MSRFAPKVAPPSPLGAGFVRDSITGLYAVDGDVPQILSGPLLATDLAIVVRDTGPVGTPNLTSYSAAMSILLTGGTVLYAAQPTATRIYQRDTRTGGAFGKGAGTVGLAVTLSASVTTLDYRLRDADTSGNPVLQDWTSLAGATPAGSASLSPAIPAGPHRYFIDVRANSDTAHAVLGTQAFGVGEVVAVAGQSLAVHALVAAYATDGQTIASAGVTPASNGYAFTPSLTEGSPAPSTTAWAVPADGTAYGSAFAAEFLRLVTGQAGVVAALTGYAVSSTAITTWQPGQANYATLRAALDQSGKFGAFIWIQGHSDAVSGMAGATYTGYLQAMFTDLAAHYAGPGGMLGGFARLICSIPSFLGYAGYTSDAVETIRAAALAYVASDPQARHVATLDATLSSDGVHPNQVGRVIEARHFYRSFMAATGLAAAKLGPSITGATRADRRW